MPLKYKILSLHIFIICLTLLFMFLIYDSYKLNQNNTYDKQIKQIVVINKEFMNNNLQYIKKEVKQTEAIFLKIENELKKMYIDDNTNVINVKDELSNRFDLKKQELSLEVFKINKDYKIIDSSNTFDINYYISINKNEKKTLSKITKVHVLKQSPGVFFDAFDQTIKKYAFFKLKDSSYLGISIIFEFSKKHKEAFKNLVISLHTKLNYRYVIRDSNKVDYTMKFFMRADEFSSRAEYYEKLYKNKKQSLIDLAFIKASKEGKFHSIEKDNKLYTYVPLLKKDNELLPLFADIVLEIESDISSEKLFFQKTYKYVIYFVLMHILMILVIFYFITSYQNIEKDLKKAILKNKNLVKYNKNFISNMVHQIRTPLAVIMSNLSLLEYFNNDKNKYAHQINASITTLSNSYENLSYINSYDSLLYKNKRIDLSDFLKKRVSYFDAAANANKMNLITNINDNIFFTINDLELERIIDNTITNAIKYSYFQKDTYITLKKNSIAIVISFKNQGYKIKNEEMLFEKKEKEENQERLNLGLYVVSLIAKKHNIKIVFRRENDFNIFEYHFKNTD
ncbi:MAG: HAMP domain-containing histidine kinase [Campylobacteraceae bacterium]|nr:HAMP domain-containing histidine kinase [Campylobacteraceae bacterium]